MHTPPALQQQFLPRTIYAVVCGPLANLWSTLDVSLPPSLICLAPTKQISAAYRAPRSLSFSLRAPPTTLFYAPSRTQLTPSNQKSWRQVSSELWHPSSTQPRGGAQCLPRTILLYPFQFEPNTFCHTGGFSAVKPPPTAKQLRIVHKDDSKTHIHVSHRFRRVRQEPTTCCGRVDKTPLKKHSFLLHSGQRMR